jgi:hypothetical protein
MLYERLTWEKMRELEAEARARTPGRYVRDRAGSLAATFVGLAGRLLRRFGAGLEDWSDRRPESRDCCEACG